MQEWGNVPDFADADVLADYPGPADDLDIRIAVATVRGLCGWHIAPRVTLTLECSTEPGSPIVLLPSYAIGEPTAVVLGRGPDAVELEPGEFEWSSNGILQLPRRCVRRNGLGTVLVTAPSGLTEAPPDLLAVVADISTARTAAATGSPVLKSRTVGGVSYTYADAVDMTDTARYAAILGRFTL